MFPTDHSSALAIYIDRYTVAGYIYMWVKCLDAKKHGVEEEYNKNLFLGHRNQSNCLLQMGVSVWSE